MNIDIDRIKKIRNIAPEVTIVAATKTVEPDTIRGLVDLGITDIGENRTTELQRKKAKLKDLAIDWHFLGSLQSNKVKSIINEIDWLHSLDRESLAKEIQNYRLGKLKCFVEVHISPEPSKAGLSVEMVVDFCKNMVKYDKIVIVGLMGMAPLTKDQDRIKYSFQKLYDLRTQIRNLKLPHAPCEFLSMGMTNDYEIAIALGATHLRLGRILFRNEE
ncbi:MAG: YggS family pyridoxal phosphate-dependent enzyme [Candidatus Izemoplasmatales bacterium]